MCFIFPPDAILAWLLKSVKRRRNTILTEKSGAPQTRPAPVALRLVYFIPMQQPTSLSLSLSSLSPESVDAAESAADAAKAETRSKRRVRSRPFLNRISFRVV